MYTIPRMASALPRLVFAAWAVVSLASCAPSAIDADRSSFRTPSATAARAAAQAELSLAHHSARYRLNLQADTRPASSDGAYLEAYRRWSEGKVRQLPESSLQDDQ